MGEKEQSENTVNVRTRDNVVHGMHKLESVLEVLKTERDDRALLGHFAQPEAPADAEAAPAVGEDA